MVLEIREYIQLRGNNPPATDTDGYAMLHLLVISVESISHREAELVERAKEWLSSP